MPQDYVPILMFAGLAFLFPAVTLWIARFLRPEARNIGSRLEPYECGIKPEGDARGRFGVRFYVIAILFVIFDVEVVFLFPWAVQYKALGLFGLIEMVVFLGILIIGYIWLYKKGALEWI
ncbi:MAG: NADH-quinone oxidoreductase subunit A [Candidatus Acidiferrales bacterium]